MGFRYYKKRNASPEGFLVWTDVWLFHDGFHFNAQLTSCPTLSDQAQHRGAFQSSTDFSLSHGCPRSSPGFGGLLLLLLLFDPSPLTNSFTSALIGLQGDDLIHCRSDRWKPNLSASQKNANIQTKRHWQRKNKQN